MSSMLRTIRRNIARNSLSNQARKNYKAVGKKAKKSGSTRAKEIEKIKQKMEAEKSGNVKS